MGLTGKTKSILILTGTLVLGMVLGGLVTGYLIRKRVDDLRALRMRQGLEAHLMEVLEPTQDQRKAVEPVIADFAADMEVLHREHGEAMRDRAEAFKAALQPLVTAEQLEKLEKSMRRMHGRRKGRGHGPHHPGGHGHPH